MASHWECDKKEVIDYAKRLYNEIDINVSRRQIEVAIEDRTSVINARKLRGNDQTREELVSLDRKMKQLADKSDNKSVYGIRAPAIAMLLYARNDFDLKATIAELVSSNPSRTPSSR